MFACVSLAMSMSQYMSNTSILSLITYQESNPLLNPVLSRKLTSLRLPVLVTMLRKKARFPGHVTMNDDSTRHGILDFPVMLVNQGQLGTARNSRERRHPYHRSLMLCQPVCIDSYPLYSSPQSPMTLRRLLERVVTEAISALSESSREKEKTFIFSAEWSCPCIKM
jgi:hypothetical protein